MKEELQIETRRGLEMSMDFRFSFMIFLAPIDQVSPEVAKNLYYFKYASDVYGMRGQDVLYIVFQYNGYPWTFFEGPYVTRVINSITREFRTKCVAFHRGKDGNVYYALHEDGVEIESLVCDVAVVEGWLKSENRTVIPTIDENNYWDIILLLKDEPIEGEPFEGDPLEDEPIFNFRSKRRTLEIPDIQEPINFHELFLSLDIWIPSWSYIPYRFDERFEAEKLSASDFVRVDAISKRGIIE